MRAPGTPNASTGRLLAAGLILVLGLGSLPSTQAIVVNAPEYVLSDKVPFVFTDADAGTKVILKVGTRTYQRTVGDSTFNITATNVTAGYTHWVMNASLDGDSVQVDGFVYYDASLKDVQARIAGVSSDVAHLQSDVGKVRSDLGRVNSTVLQGRNATTRIATNLTAIKTAVGGNKSSVAQADPASNQAASEAKDAHAAASAAAGYGQRLTIYVLAAALVTLGAFAFVLYQLKRRSQEQLLVLLAVASHEGITPSSPEYQKALEAIHGKPKPKKAKKVKVAKV